MGLITKMRAGSTPANKVFVPSCRIRSISVPSVDRGFLLDVPGSASLSDSVLRAVIRVFTTQMGLVTNTVILPAIAPAIIDSTAVSLFEARPAFSAAFSNAPRVHSYQ